MSEVSLKGRVGLDSGPGYAFTKARDTHEEIGRKMAAAFAPLLAMREGMLRALDDEHRWRDPQTGRFVRRTR